MLFSFFPLPSLGQGKITFCYESIAQPPYYFGEGAEVPRRNPGLYISLVKIIAESEGIDISFRRMPWIQCLRWFRRGDIDALLSSPYLKQRERFGVYPGGSGDPDERYRISRKSYYEYTIFPNSSRIGKHYYTRRNILISVIRGYGIENALRKKGIDRFVFVDAPRDGLQLLESRQIGSFINLELPTDSQVDILNLRNLRKSNLPVWTRNDYVVFNRVFYKKNRELADRFWSEIFHQKKFFGLD
ncbi:hypothetical protein [Aestuariispira insulae]|uniref:Amino acid ABC transporter substrate-binding protein (PAAT family) n=1 Tax=Aestuariispira insulae TaxID=1461337 RepID=A0A3D9HNJ1_9PROT|nr:hypothetical protein [Aestuariispira insulae]RED51054.1 amino acid ABC transporter substrate-binding protein (PAAT family) [Aestuariispira insulae]